MQNVLVLVLRRCDKWGVLILLAASLSVNAYLVRQLQRPAKTTNKGSPVVGYQVGQVMPVLRAKDIGGNPVVLDWAARNVPTVLYVFSVTCSWCTRNLRSIKTLAISAVGYQVIGLAVSADGLREYLEAHDLPFPVYQEERPRGGSLLVSGTPETFVISADGKLQEHWMGAYMASTQQDIERKLGVRLPEIGPDGPVGGAGVP